MEILDLTVIPLRRVVLYPHIALPIGVTSPRLIAAAEAALERQDHLVAVLLQKDANEVEPELRDLQRIGVIGSVRQVDKSADRLDLIVTGEGRIRCVEGGVGLKGKFERLPWPTDSGPRVEALDRELLRLAERLEPMGQTQGIAPLQLLKALDDPLDRVYLLGWLLEFDAERGQAILEAPDRASALERACDALHHELEVQDLQRSLAGKVAEEMGRESREGFLRRQMKAIREELGEDGEADQEIKELAEALDKADLPEHARKQVAREFKRLERLPPMVPDHSVIRSYLEFVSELPWNKTERAEIDTEKARRILDEDHFGLQEVKERILEHIAVMRLNPRARAPILCFVGPPGTGKTSLGQSIARALGRRFERLTLGGLHDEAELRGHRRTYVGAMPGAILQAVHRAGVKDPVIMLDEVDKVGRDFCGDPAAALMEILDPRDNAHFRDNYLGIEFDLSEVLFLTTANSLEPIPRPLLDRLEVLRLPGYAEEEKQAIARRWLLPRQIAEAGLDPALIEVPDPTILKLIRDYTREAGVRELDRLLGRIARRTALAALPDVERLEHGISRHIAPETLPELLGPVRFFEGLPRRELPPGVVAGMAWTEAGGEIIYVEAACLPGDEGLVLTGNLGEVMRESARTALSYVHSLAARLGLDPAVFARHKVHLHVPAVAVAKDGPSAGLAMAAALASAFSGRSLRADVAMTGEITLTGIVMPVGGIREKVYAANRAGLRQVILPAENLPHLAELPESVRSSLEFLPVTTVLEALEVVLPLATNGRLLRVSGLQESRERPWPTVR